MTTAEVPALLTAAEACKALRVSRSTLGRLIGRGDPAKRLTAVEALTQAGIPIRSVPKGGEPA